jgi:hypothetical protein
LSGKSVGSVVSALAGGKTSLQALSVLVRCCLGAAFSWAFLIGAVRRKAFLDSC